REVRLRSDCNHVPGPDRRDGTDRGYFPGPEASVHTGLARGDPDPSTRPCSGAHLASRGGPGCDPPSCRMPDPSPVTSPPPDVRLGGPRFRPVPRSTAVAPS